MKKVLKPLSLAAAISAAMVSGHVAAYEAGDWIVRAGVTTVDPQESSNNVISSALGDTGSEAGVDSGSALGINIEYMLTDNWGIELLAATPFEHTASGKGGALGGLDVANIKHLPPTLMAVYHFDTAGRWDPYIGAGINYTPFFSEEVDNEVVAAGLGDGDVDLDNSWGLSVQVGVDYQINEKWHLNASVRWIDIDTEADFEFDAGSGALGGTTATVDIDIDPLVYSVLVGYKF